MGYEVLSWHHIFGLVPVLSWLAWLFLGSAEKDRTCLDHSSCL